MLATIIREQFAWENRKAVADALDDLCAPTDAYGWASAGVYAFWCVEGPSLLYIGLASDLAQRFRQHVGLLSAPQDGCKLREIRAHFKDNDKLGFSVLVQSPMSQPRVSRATPPAGDDEAFPTHGAGAIKFSEGLLIGAYRRRHNSLPPWNKVEGAVAGQNYATAGHCFLVDLLSGVGDDTMVARRSLRQISADPTACTFEEYLHGVRQASVGGSFVETYARFSTEIQTKRRIEAGYWTMEAMERTESRSAERFRAEYASGAQG